MLRKLIDQAKVHIKINIDEEIKELEEQLEDNERWERECKEVIVQGNYNQARILIEQLKNDKDSNFTLIDKQVI